MCFSVPTVPSPRPDTGQLVQCEVHEYDNAPSSHLQRDAAQPLESTIRIEKTWCCIWRIRCQNVYISVLVELGRPKYIVDTLTHILSRSETPLKAGDRLARIEYGGPETSNVMVVVHAPSDGPEPQIALHTAVGFHVALMHGQGTNEENKWLHRPLLCDKPGCTCGQPDTGPIFSVFA